MGWRTVVILNNDLSHEWQKDPELGRLIATRQHSNAAANYRSPGYFKYGTVIEVAHCDKQTLGTLDTLTFTPLAHGNWMPEQSATERDLRLLKDAADKLGYRLVKKPNVKATEEPAEAKIVVTPRYN